ncbi:MAG: hypothetical protein H6672_00385 [Anaerolineaceae bacterium]|nr:hypothetical protein [Anaerolineaceae bacterium]
MRLIGTVKLVQVQHRPLKVGVKPDRTYDPAGLQVVDHLLLTPEGVIGVTAGGERLTDVHHSAHPETRSRGDNGLSIGLTAYYQQMRSQFGDHLTDAIAGENIIIESDQPYTLDELGDTLVFENSATGARVRVEVLGSAAPCVPFSQFAAGRKLEGEELKETLRSLDNGVRGFLLAVLPTEDDQIVQAGDVVYA